MCLAIRRVQGDVRSVGSIVVAEVGGAGACDVDTSRGSRCGACGSAS